jgi:hypothetical protein
MDKTLPAMVTTSGFKPRRGPLAALLGALMRSGCASVSPDGGMSVVVTVAIETIKKDVVSIRTVEDAERARSAVQALLHRSLTVDTAVQIALPDNRGLQAPYNELALAEVEFVEGSLLPNPTFAISRIIDNSGYEIERQLVGDILALATLPFRSEIAPQRLQKAQLRAALETMWLAAEIRHTYYRAVATNEFVGLLTDAKSTAESTAALALKLGEIGSLNKLEHARARVFYAETTADLAILRACDNPPRTLHPRLPRLRNLAPPMEQRLLSATWKHRRRDRRARRQHSFQTSKKTRRLVRNS